MGDGSVLFERGFIELNRILAEGVIGLSMSAVGFSF